MLLHDKPVRSAGESELEYIARLGRACIEANERILRQIDKSIGSGYRSQSTIDGPKNTPNTINGKAKARAKTLHDFLAENDIAREIYRNGGI